MNKTFYAVTLAVLVAGSFLAGSWCGQRRATRPAPSGERKALYYVDPMHPTYRSDKPGIAPDCSMPLEPVYADADGGPPPAGPGSRPASAGAVRLSAEKQQALGVRLGTVERAPGSETLRTTGRVAARENATYRLLAAADGWIREVRSATTGSLVRKDEVLASFYAPEFLGAEQAYIYALDAFDRFVSTGKETPEQIALTKANIQQAVDALRNLGMAEPQVAEIGRDRNLVQDIHVVAPAIGFVLERDVSVGQRFERGTQLYRIADLSRVWILADVLENEAPFVKPGLVARVSTARGTRSFTARVSDVLPRFDADSRTLKVRLETDNPGYALWPDMFVDVVFTVGLPEAVSVPAEAVLDSGLRRTVYVVGGDGGFEPRQVRTGRRLGDRVEILEGLTEGERIVTSGHFLLDSESRMRTAGAEETPEGEAEAHGEASAKALAPAAPDATATATDPVCGMSVDMAKAKAAGRTSAHGGRTYYFCAPGCKETFDKDPAAHAKPRS